MTVIYGSQAPVYRVCDHCTRATNGSTMAVLRVRGWRIFQGESQTGKLLSSFVCPWCAGTTDRPDEDTGWTVGCHTCFWEWEDWYDEGPLTEKDARRIGDDHECEPDVYVNPPKRPEEPAPAEITGRLL